MADVIVIGGGAAGLMAGITAARQDASVVVLERMKEPGKKMMITGKGRCNITNACPMEEFIPNLPGNGKFLFSALQQFTNDDLLRFFQEQGLKTVTERGGRVFPATGKAKDVIAVLRSALQKAGGRLVTGAQATGFTVKPGQVTGIRYRTVENDGRRDGQDFRSQTKGKMKLGPEHTLDAGAVIVCTGGASYPGTGSDGNFVPVLEMLGLSIEPLLPALVPLQPEEGFTEELEGLQLKNVEASVLADSKVVAKEFGELQFIRGGIAGPICLTMSRKVARLQHYNQPELELSIDLKPALSDEKLEARLIRDFQEFSKLRLAEVVRKLLPQPLVEPVLDTAFLDGKKQVSQVSKEERLALVQAVKHFTIPLMGTRPLAEAIVTAGGVALKEIDPKTMKAKRIAGLYFAGEVMDVDGYTGGFNLQAAFSSGYVAGVHAAKQVLNR
ncbi:NAD(P)/FAD-dependent oxidoreductase [uncultured Succiniclasticum sp.]|uniref:NAD(P)/FAD-dependent oxidoreductase n=1 Tax=uncultured Succiniclasticum sp. TaxID=1500547 RepID=UPI0025CF210A|nr:NAD(P)/FAD-dependent oxidoreductase [uncultured Succiniclasticum sp.]